MILLAKIFQRVNDIITNFPLKKKKYSLESICYLNK